MNPFNFGCALFYQIKQAQQPQPQPPAQNPQAVQQPNLTAQPPQQPQQLWRRGANGNWTYVGPWNSKPYDPYGAAEIYGQPPESMTVDKARLNYNKMLNQYRTGSWSGDVQSNFASAYGDEKNPQLPVHPPKFDLAHVKTQIEARQRPQRPTMLQMGADAPIQLPAGVR